MISLPSFKKPSDGAFSEANSPYQLANPELGNWLMVTVSVSPFCTTVMTAERSRFVVFAVAVTTTSVNSPSPTAVVVLNVSQSTFVEIEAVPL